MSTTAASLDALDYNPVDHLNALFGQPSTLSSVAAVSKALSSYQDDLDGEIEDLVATQAASDSDSIQRIQAAKQDLDELFRKIDHVQARAAQTEQTITAMTADIKRLDGTKRNLTLSMTALKRLQMLTTAYEQLQGLSSTRQYRESAQLLQAVIQLMAHFKTYRSVDQIAALGRSVSDTQRDLLEQVCEDFELSFARGEVEQKRAMLAEACLVMDALGDNARSRLITWYCNTQLREYRALFRSSDEAGSLDNISRRYSWFRRLLKTYDEQHAAIFPSHWHVDEVLANAFCEGTRDDFRSVLSKAVKKTEGRALDPDLLLSCLQETLDFEHSLERKFVQASRASSDTVASTDEPRQPYTHAMSEAFEPYLSVWIDAQDKKLDQLIAKYRGQPPLGPDETFHPQMVITTSSELFGFYRALLSQCIKLSTGQRLLDLSKVFGRHLEKYAQQVLLNFISERPSGQTPSRIPSMEDVVLVLNTADYCFSTSTQLEERIKARIDDKFKEQVDLETQADEFMGIANASVRWLVRKVEVRLDPAWRVMRNVGWSRIEAVSDQSSYVNEITTALKEQATMVLEVVQKQQYARAFCDNAVEALSSAFAANIMQCKPITEVGAEQLLLDLYALTKQAEELIVLNAPEGTAVPAGFRKRANQTLSRIAPLLKTIQVRPSPPEALVAAYLVHIADKSDTNFRKILEIKGIRRQDQAQLMELFVAHKTGPRYENLPTQSALLTALGTSGTTYSTGGGMGLGSAIPGLPVLGVSGGGGIGSSGGVGVSARPGLPNLFDSSSSLGTAFLSAAKDSVDKLGGGSPSISASIAGSSPSRANSPHPLLSGAAGAGSSGIAANNNNSASNITATHLAPGSGSAMMSPMGSQQSQSGSGTGEATTSAVPATTNNVVNQNLRNLGKFFKRDLASFGGRFGGGNANANANANTSTSNLGSAAGGPDDGGRT